MADTSIRGEIVAYNNTRIATQRMTRQAVFPIRPEKNKLANPSIEFSLDGLASSSSSDSTRSGERTEPQSRGSGENVN